MRRITKHAIQGPNVPISKFSIIKIKLGFSTKTDAETLCFGRSLLTIEKLYFRFTELVHCTVTKFFYNIVMIQYENSLSITNVLTFPFKYQVTSPGGVGLNFDTQVRLMVEP